MLKLPALTPEEQRVRDMIWEREMEMMKREILNRIKGVDSIEST